MSNFLNTRNTDAFEITDTQEVVVEFNTSSDPEATPRKKSQKKSPGHKTPSLSRQVDMISEEKTSDEIYKKPNKRKHQKKKSGNSSVAKQDNITITTETSPNIVTPETQQDTIPNTTPEIQEVNTQDSTQDKAQDKTVDNNRKQREKQPHTQRRQTSGFAHRQSNKVNEQKKEDKEKQTPSIATPNQIKKVTMKGDNERKAENYNQVMFSGAVIDEVRELLNKQGIETKKLDIQPLAPILVLQVNPKETFADAFGFHTTWMITGYSNDGNTERLHLSLINAPVLLGESDEDNLDTGKVINEVKAEIKRTLPEFEFSIIISKNKDAKTTTVLPEIKKVSKPFSIDGVLCGVYITGSQKIIYTKNTAPKNLVRQNYNIFQDLTTGKIGTDIDTIKRYFRKYTRTMTDRERKILFDELSFFTESLKLDDQLSTLGVINEIRM